MNTWVFVFGKEMVTTTTTTTIFICTHSCLKMNYDNENIKNKN